MVTHNVRLDYVQENRYLLWDRDGFPIVMAPSPNGVNGADLLPLSLIGCSAWDIMDLLNDQGVTVAGLEVVADCQQDDDPPWRFQRISVHYRFHGRDLDISSLRRAIQQSEEKYCSIYNTLRGAVEISTDIEIIDDEPGR